jgi:hypothetical protein
MAPGTAAPASWAGAGAGAGSAARAASRHWGQKPPGASAGSGAWHTVQTNGTLMNKSGSTPAQRLSLILTT